MTISSVLAITFALLFLAFAYVLLTAGHAFLAFVIVLLLLMSLKIR